PLSSPEIAASRPLILGFGLIFAVSPTAGPLRAGDAVGLAEPAVEVDLLAAHRAERLDLVVRRLAANRTACFSLRHRAYHHSTSRPASGHGAGAEFQQGPGATCCRPIRSPGRSPLPHVGLPSPAPA